MKICVSICHPFNPLTSQRKKPFENIVGINPFPKRQVLESYRLKEFADDNFNVDENGRKFSKWIESTVGKGEIARYEQFLLFPQCFQKACIADL